MWTPSREAVTLDRRKIEANSVAGRQAQTTKEALANATGRTGDRRGATVAKPPTKNQANNAHPKAIARGQMVSVSERCSTRRESVVLGQPTWFVRREVSAVASSSASGRLPSIEMRHGWRLYERPACAATRHRAAGRGGSTGCCRSPGPAHALGHNPTVGSAGRRTAKRPFEGGGERRTAWCELRRLRLADRPVRSHRALCGELTFVSTWIQSRRALGPPN